MRFNLLDIKGKSNTDVDTYLNFFTREMLVNGLFNFGEFFNR
jgi:hypothetical protein